MAIPETRPDAPIDDRGPLSRRSYLATLATAGAATIAGCNGGGSGGGGDGGDPGNNSTDVPGTGSSDGTGTACPEEFTYVAQEFSALGYDGAVGVCDVPETARIQGGELTSMGQGLTVIVEFEDGSFRSLDVATDFTEEAREVSPTVGGVVDDIREQADQHDWSDVTGRFELSGAGGTVIASSDDAALPASTWRVYDHPEGVLAVGITHGGQGCPDASARVYERLVESQEPA